MAELLQKFSSKPWQIGLGLRTWQAELDQTAIHQDREWRGWPACLGTFQETSASPNNYRTIVPLYQTRPKP